MFNFELFLPYQINRTGVRLATAFSNELERFDLKLPMWRVLAVLWRHHELKIGDLMGDTSDRAIDAFTPADDDGRAWIANSCA